MVEPIPVLGRVRGVLGAWRRPVGRIHTHFALGVGIALLIRILGVGLSYLMYVVLARRMTVGVFGQFGFAWSAATFFGLVSLMGQHSLALRFIPAYEADGQRGLVRQLARESRLLVLAAGLALAAVVWATGTVWHHSTGASTSYVGPAALLMVAWALSQHQAHVLRALDRLVLALAPGDVVWRSAVIGLVLLLGSHGRMITATQALYICFAVLAVVLLAQAWADPTMRSLRSDAPRNSSVRKKWVQESLGLWSATVLQGGMPHLSVVLLGMTLSPQDTGPFFAALKTATLLGLPLTAANMVGAPLIARFYHAHDLHQVQRISNYVVLAVVVPVAIGFLALVFGGEIVLGYFGEGFGVAKTALIVLAFANVLNALCGPTATIMNMTGHHREYIGIALLSQSVAMAALPLAALQFGMTGAAVAVGGGLTAWNFLVWRWSRRNIGVDPTLLGLARLRLR